jgi:hypothetical protein
MQRFAETVEAYIQSIPNGQQALVIQLRETIRSGLPEGFEEVMQSNGISS